MKEKTVSFFERFYVSIKLITIGFLILILLIPLGMIKSLIRERESRQSEAIYEVSSKWGEQQLISGPFITVPYKTYYLNADKEVIEDINYAHFLPNELNISGEVFPEIRYRGIFETVVYNTKVAVEGHFLRPDFKGLNVQEKSILWEDAFISLGITDLRGIEKNIEILLDKEMYMFESGVPTNDIFESGVNAKIAINAFSSDNISFEFDLDMNGSNELKVVPVGKKTNINISSNWKDPSFIGASLPDNRDISEERFTANWEILHLNRNYPQKWKNSQFKIFDSSVGVSLLLPVDRYQKSMRSVKYAILFISLTFLTFFFVEIINKKRIHPIQYILVGLGLSLFYVLLISLSEHIGFGLSYFLASVGIIGMISLYSHSIYKNTRLSLITLGILSILYGYIYTIIHLQDLALLMGSIGLFIILGAVMYLSRKIDWYTAGLKKGENNL